MPRRRLAVAIPQARLHAFADLREAVESLPAQTRRAMLAGIRAHKIVAGAYTDNDGGACPMLAAHREGSRTPALDFADAWDAFTGTKSPWYRRSCSPRPATDEELYALASLLERSIRHDPAPPERAPQVEEAPLQSGGVRAGEPHRARELRNRPGWAWLRPVRDYDSLLRMIRLAEEAARDGRARQALSSASSRSARLRQ